ncbi:MAG TPA: choice-of-anchor tandem repeat GloVer-containing protein [Burkholderiaceae bacterium]|jgi:uncharacterized repeat protein (TIGR03803 family)|nr:choice-of-anchor tandem repeat GloVer-containing protein [Burkholderiaceae bacterium]
MSTVPAFFVRTSLRPAVSLVVLAALVAAGASAFAADLPRITAMKPASTGSAPGGRLVALPDGNLYGTAQAGGSADAGTVFVVNPKGHVSTLHEFTGDDGYAPVAGLTLGTDGMLYGTTALGGANGLGVVFRIATDGTFTLLHSFDDAHDVGTSYVRSALTQGPDGNFYGTGPFSAGYPEQNGTVFRVTPTGETTILYVFGTRVREPDAGVTFGADGRLYGLAAKDGRKDCGVLYSLATDGSGFRMDYQFDHGHAGCHPLSSMVLGDDGRLYGTTQYGGPKGGIGAMFRLDTSASLFKILHVFHDDDLAGSDPSAGLALGPNGDFYGVTSFGAANLMGAVFKATPAGKIAVVHPFAAKGREGQGAQSSPVPDGSRHLVGGLLAGGHHQAGTIYRIDSGIAK